MNLKHGDLRRWAVLVLTLLSGCGIFDGQRQTSNSGPPVARTAGTEPTEEQSLDVQLSLARMLEQQGDLQRAAELYLELLREHPRDPAARHRLAIVYDRQSLFDQSDEMFRKARELAPRDASVCCDYGYSLYLQGRWDEAERELREAIALRPDDRRARNHLGMLLVRTGRRDEAFVEFRRSGCTPAEAHLNAALGCLLDDRFDDARQEYRSALQAEPVTPLASERLQRLETVFAALPEPGAPAIELTRSQHRSQPAPGTARVQ